MPDVFILAVIDSMRQQLEQLNPMKREDEERLWKKFRLEWNYNSNHIEGSTLTYKQTELLLIFEKTTGDHDMREYEEMKAHDVALRMVTEYAKDSSREITETDIREINKIILVRPFWSNAQTPDGQPTRKLIQPGEYKKEPNSVLLQNGEMFHYASPEDTPVMMKELLEWYSDAVKQKKLHPVEIAALIHHKFVRIHPFDDSNGRTSRLLMNYVLLRYGYPPVIIKSADKKNYLNALNKADVGDVDAFVEYIAEQLVSSLQLSIKAGSGISIEEYDDVDKEINVWKKQLSKEKNSVNKSVQLVLELYEKSFRNLIITFIDEFRQFDEVFVVNSTDLNIREAIGFTSSAVFRVDSIKSVDDKVHFFLDHAKADFETKPYVISIKKSFEGFKAKLENLLRIESTLQLELGIYYYRIIFNQEELVSSLYSEFISSEKANLLVREMKKITFNDIKETAARKNENP